MMREKDRKERKMKELLHKGEKESRREESEIPAT